MNVSRKNYLWMNVIILLLPLFLFGQESNEAQLQQMIQQALQNNPALQAAQQRVLTVEKTISQARSLPDPKLTVGVMNLPVNSFAFNQEPMTGKLISVMQMFPLAGKLSLNKKMAEIAVESEKYKQQETANQIVTMVKKAFYNLYAIDRALEVVESNRSLMQQFVAVAEIKYATGSGLQQDVLRAQVELSKIEDDIFMWRQKREAMAARLNALLNKEQSAEIPQTTKEMPIIPVPSLESPVRESRPLLKAWREIINRAETATERAKRNYWPDVTVSAGYTQRNDLQNGAVMHDFFSTTASINIPLYFAGKQRANVQEKELNALALRSQYLNVLNNVKADSASVMAELERNRKRIDLYENGILLQARQSLESALSGYQVDKVDFLTLINNWTMLQNYEMQYYRALADYRISLAQYDFVTGRTWMN